jgi:hypothetical protein
VGQSVGAEGRAEAPNEARHDLAQMVVENGRLYRKPDILDMWSNPKVFGNKKVAAEASRTQDIFSGIAYADDAPE